VLCVLQLAGVDWGHRGCTVTWVFVREREVWGAGRRRYSHWQTGAAATSTTTPSTTTTTTATAASTIAKELHTGYLRIFFQQIIRRHWRKAAVAC
jgi:hypothetical protein